VCRLYYAVCCMGAGKVCSSPAWMTVSRGDVTNSCPKVFWGCLSKVNSVRETLILVRVNSVKETLILVR
jgi:hypothetical protein